MVATDLSFLWSRALLIVLSCRVFRLESVVHQVYSAAWCLTAILARARERRGKLVGTEGEGKVSATAQLAIPRLNLGYFRGARVGGAHSWGLRAGWDRGTPCFEDHVTLAITGI